MKGPRVEFSGGDPIPNTNKTKQREQHTNGWYILQTRTTPEDTMLSEKSYCTWFHLAKFQRDRKPALAQDWQLGELGTMATGRCISFRDDENVPQLIVVMVVQLWIYWKPLSCTLWMGELYGKWITFPKKLLLKTITIMRLWMSQWLRKAEGHKRLPGVLRAKDVEKASALGGRFLAGRSPVPRDFLCSAWASASTHRRARPAGLWNTVPCGLRLWQEWHAQWVAWTKHFWYHLKV